MRVWVDAKLPPVLASWLKQLGVNAKHVVDLGKLGATDAHIFAGARDAGAIAITKDDDFLRPLERQ